MIKAFFICCREHACKSLRTNESKSSFQVRITFLPSLIIFPGPGHIQAQTVQSQDPQEHAESLRANSGMEY